MSERWTMCVGLGVFGLLSSCGQAPAAGSGTADEQAGNSGTPAAVVAETSGPGDVAPPGASVGMPAATSESVGTLPLMGGDNGNGATAPGSAPPTVPSSMGPPSSTPEPAGNAPAPNTSPEPSAEAQTCNASGAASPTTPTIWVIGDSTASEYTSELYPRMGWAQPLQSYFAPACATVRDRAISGRSSKSFFDEGAWNPVRDGLKAGDFVLIQFGHNDEKSDDPTRFTDPFTTFQQFLSIYVDDALARGATPVLITSIQRNNWDGASLRDTHGDYPAAMRQLATMRGVSLIDATQLTEAYFERQGQAATTLLFMDLAAGQFPNYPDGNTDNTHLQEAGAHAIAQLLLADFARQRLPIGRLVKVTPEAP
jgi:lysophospholipase L1-like esterase